jgi:hypothetical protein
MSSTLGAPLGGTIRGAHHGVDSEARSLRRRKLLSVDCGGRGGRAQNTVDLLRKSRSCGKQRAEHQSRCAGGQFAAQLGFRVHIALLECWKQIDRRIVVRGHRPERTGRPKGLIAGRIGIVPASRRRIVRASVAAVIGIGVGSRSGRIESPATCGSARYASERKRRKRQSDKIDED